MFFDCCVILKIYHDTPPKPQYLVHFILSELPPSSQDYVRMLLIELYYRMTTPDY